MIAPYSEGSENGVCQATMTRRRRAGRNQTKYLPALLEHPLKIGTTGEVSDFR
jgi:hypothetical protein